MLTGVFWWSLSALGTLSAGAATWWLWRRHRTLNRRRLVEDALKHLHTCKWRGGRATYESLCGALHLSASAAVGLLAQMEKEGLVRSSGEGLSLTPLGESMALAIIRAHRLWERYLADEARMQVADIHVEAELREHDLSPTALDVLEAALGHPATDPHGDPIPSASGELAQRDLQPLTVWPLHTLARIVHLEDEPIPLFAQLAAIGLYPGQLVQVLESNEQRLVLSDGGATHILAPIVAANVFVAAAGVQYPDKTKRLSSLEVGQQATVLALSESLRGFTRRRLLDLGLTPGVTVTHELSSMLRNPSAYRVRGTLIALRRDQAYQVLIRDPGAPTTSGGSQPPAGSE